MIRACVKLPYLRLRLWLPFRLFVKQFPHSQACLGYNKTTRLKSFVPLRFISLYPATLAELFLFGKTMDPAYYIDFFLLCSTFKYQAFDFETSDFIQSIPAHALLPADCIPSEYQIYNRFCTIDSMISKSC
jgi:hypothetical protein